MENASQVVNEQISLLHAGILGVIQGLTEFLPVSSSAHLIVFSEFMDGKPLPLTVNLGLHVGTLLAVIIYFWRDWLGIVEAVILRVAKGKKSFGSDRLLPALIVGSIPAGVIGILFQDAIEEKLHHPLIVIFPLAFVGWALWWFDNKLSIARRIEDITLKDAIVIGLAQALALVPGVSRSGITILAGRFMCLRREDAARFSFLLGTPAIAGAALINYKDILAHATDPAFLLGIATSAITGCLAIAFLLTFLKKAGFALFMWYRFALAAVLAYVYFR